MELSEAIERSRVDNVFLRKGPRQPQSGSLALIGHHLIFSPSNAKKKKTCEELWLLHRAVDLVSVEPKNRENPLKGGFLTLKCKNFMVCEFEMDDFEDCIAVARSIQRLSNLDNLQHEYPFYYQCPFTILDDGWTAFDAEQEFAKLMVRSSDKWRLSNVNKDYRVCPSYPEMVVVPKGIGDDFLRISATFRSGGRFPVLCYYHLETKLIVHCGQPLIGPTNRRCKEDEIIINSLLPSSSKGVIVDVRSKQIGQGAKAKGGGCEPQVYYSQWKYIHSAVPRIREIRDSLTKLVEVCNEPIQSMDRWLSKINASGWMQAVADALTAAATIAQCVYCEGSSETPVVVHGSNGTDTTLLATSVSQILLDSDARTTRGFEALIEREWISSGHPFSIRCAHSAFSTVSMDESPVFLLFLDCVCNRKFCLCISIYNTMFILRNNEKEKARLNIKKCTVSLWSYVNNPEILRSFVNVLYEPNDAVLWPSVAPQSLTFWDRLFLRWTRDWKEYDEQRQAVMKWKLREKANQSKYLALKRQFVELTKESNEKTKVGVIDSIR
uniref:Myotubularin phosphatase domain-containing protein n=1 Tax=Syphacia muris TaxID=451379 RepID=A0A0N5AGS3_9BILA